VKLEGGEERGRASPPLVAVGIPVMVTWGMTPQSCTSSRLQLKEPYLGAGAHHRAGARSMRRWLYAMVLESIPAALAAEITRPVLFHHRMVRGFLRRPGAGHARLPRLDPDWSRASHAAMPNWGARRKRPFRRYAADVRAGRFPSKKESFS